MWKFLLFLGSTFYKDICWTTFFAMTKTNWANSVNIWKFIMKNNLSLSMSLEWIKSLELFNFWWLALTGAEKSASSSTFCCCSWFPPTFSLLWSPVVSDRELVDSIRFVLQAIICWLPWSERFIFRLILFFLTTYTL